MGAGVTLTVERGNAELSRGLALILRYGFSVVCVGIAVGPALALQHYNLRDLELPVFELAIVMIAWYAGLGPSVLGVVLTMGLFSYFFLEPLYSLDFSTGHLPYLVLLLVWAGIVASFVNVRRQIENDLRHARDNLQLEVEQRKQHENDIRNLNLELAGRAADLEASNKELELFAYSVSHDLRAPLRHSAGYAELLQKQASSTLDEKSRRYLQTILNSVKRMGNLIDDLLAFSRIGRAETKRGPVNLQQLVKRGRRGESTRTRAGGTLRGRSARFRSVTETAPC